MFSQTKYKCIYASIHKIADTNNTQPSMLDNCMLNGEKLAGCNISKEFPVANH